MAVIDPMDLLARAATPGRDAMRVLTGRWDGRRFHPSETPQAELEADNAAGNLAPGAFVYALHDGKRVTILGPAQSQPTATVGTAHRQEWIRFPEGVQICWLLTNEPRVATQPYGALHQGTWTWTYALPFHAQPIVVVGTWRWETGAAWGTTVGLPGVTSCALRGIDAVPRYSHESLHISAMAVGRWRS